MSPESMIRMIVRCLMAAILTALFLLVVQSTPTALAQDSGDLWIGTMKVSGSVTSAQIQDSPSSESYNYDFQVNPASFALYDKNLPILPDSPRIICTAQTTTLSGQATFVSTNGEWCSTTLSAYSITFQVFAEKNPLTNSFLLTVVIHPHISCGSGCCIPDQGVLVASDNCAAQGLFVNLSHDELSSSKKITRTFQYTLSLPCLAQAGFEYYSSYESYTLTWNGALEIDISSFVPNPNPGGTTGYSISGKVTDSGGAPVSGVAMALAGAASATVQTAYDGSYIFLGLPAGSYEITPSKDSDTFSPQVRTPTITNQNIVSQDFTMLSGLWRDAVDFGSGWKWLGWFGYFNTNGFPWIYHQTLGWLYPFGTSTDSVWFWDASMNSFLWTSRTVYPYFYGSANQAWLYYLDGSHNPEWFFNYGTSQWVSVAGP